jgi:hypothetical protein
MSQQAGLEPYDREVGRSSGQKPRAGRWPGSRSPGFTPVIRQGSVAVGSSRSRPQAEMGPKGLVTAWGRSTRRRTEAQEGRGVGGYLNRSCRPPHASGEQGPEVEGGHAGGRVKPVRRVRSTARGQRPGKPGTAPDAGQFPVGRNPGFGSGVKQTRKAGGGVNRRGRAKRRGRNVAWGWVPCA